MAYLSETFPAPAIADTGITALLGQGANSFFPQVGVTLPPDKAYDPFILVKFDDWIRLDHATGSQIGRFIVHDLPEHQYWTINDIIALIIRRYSDPHPWYDDAEGAVIGQQVAFVSQPNVDDGWKRLTRWVDVQLFRSM